MSLLIIRIVFVTLISLKWATLLQHDFKLLHGLVRATKNNPVYLENTVLVSFWYNKTQQALNASGTIVQDLDDKLRINVTIYKWVKNKWRPFPPTPVLDVVKNPCMTLKSNAFDIQKYAAVYNFSECPIPKGFYEINNFFLDETQFPPHSIPYGKYRLTTDFYMFNVNNGDIINIEYEVEVTLERKTVSRKISSEPKDFTSGLIIKKRKADSETVELFTNIVIIRDV